jgi:hypothetical protein
MSTQTTEQIMRQQSAQQGRFLAPQGQPMQGQQMQGRQMQQRPQGQPMQQRPQGQPMQGQQRMQGRPVQPQQIQGNIFDDFITNHCYRYMPAPMCNVLRVTFRIAGFWIAIAMIIIGIILLIFISYWLYKKISGAFQSLKGPETANFIVFNVHQSDPTNDPYINDLFIQDELIEPEYNPICDVRGSIYGGPLYNTQCDTCKVLY